jgi:hypothetical protein
MGDEVPDRFLNYLRQEGFVLFPGEMNCHTPGHHWVDVAASKSRALWAFEYKSKTDSLSRGLAQCTSYSQAFDYVVLVSEGKRLTRSSLFWDFRRKGIGLWLLQGSSVRELSEPQTQIPERRYRARAKTQFLRLTGVAATDVLGPSMLLDSFVQPTKIPPG